MMSAISPSCAEIHIFGKINSETEKPCCRNDSPKSPRSAAESQRPYCSRIEPSRPRSARTCARISGSRNWPAATAVGSPGPKRAIEKVAKETTSRMKGSQISRRTM